MGLLPDANELEQAGEKLVDHTIPPLAAALEHAIRTALDGLDVTITVNISVKAKVPNEKA